MWCSAVSREGKERPPVRATPRLVAYAFDAVACLSAEVVHSFEIGDQARARRVPFENFLRLRT